MKKCGKLFFALLLCAALFAVLAAAVNADDPEIVASGECGAHDSNVIWTLYNDGMLAIEGTGDMKDYDSYCSLPWRDYRNLIMHIKIYPGVFRIGNFSFLDCSELTSITIPSSIMSIGNYAFCGCEKLESITIPEGVLNIGDSAFSSCSALSNVSIPSSVTSIDSYAFSSCTSLTSVTISNGVTMIADNVFSDCSSLSSVKIPSSVTSIGSYAFWGCNSLISINIPDNVTSIGSYTFENCSALTNITIPEKVTSIGNSTFSNCSSLVSIALPDNLTSIGNSAFSGCSSLSCIIIPDDVTSIGDSAFMDCASLADVNIPENITMIGKKTFEQCFGLTCITIPNNISFISRQAFYNCNRLKSVIFTGAAPTIEYSAFGLVVSTMYYPVNDSSWTSDIQQNYGGSLTWLEFKEPRILIQPKNVSIDEGRLASFEVVAEGATDYQWYYQEMYESSWKKVTGDWNIAVYRLKADANYNGYKFKCIVSNAAGSISSDVVTLTVIAKPKITTQPKDCTVNEGDNASFTVVASGTDLSYQWYCRSSSSGSWVACAAASAKTATHKPAALPKYSGYQYKCVVTNSAGSVESNIVTLTVISKPTITTQPTNCTTNEGGSASFTVVASGTDLSYQWYCRSSSAGSWVACTAASATTATHRVAGNAKFNGYQFKCVVANSAGSVTSDIVTLTVTLKPVITTQPKNVSVAAGKTATFKVAATGATNYQWYYRTSEYDAWTAVKTNGKTATYTLTTAARHDGYQYRCKVTNAAGSTYSNVATLTIIAKPTITTQPTSKSVAAGKTATFKVVATGATAYQWYYRTSSSGDWAAVKTNGKAATYTLSAAARHNGYQYRCKVSNAAGSVYSKVVTLAVASKPTITTQPVSVTVSAGKTATFKVAASGTGLSYQWYYRTSSSGEWMAVKTNGKAATYTLSAAARHNGYQYRCKVSNAAGSVYSKVVTLAVASKPTITTQPVSVTVSAGKTATFKVVATGGGLSYQWYYLKPGASSWTKVSSNGTSATYKLTTAARHTGYQYKCVVTNSAGSVTSSVVTLTVK